MNHPNIELVLFVDKHARLDIAIASQRTHRSSTSHGRYHMQ
jgi:hypothetical protein